MVLWGPLLPSQRLTQVRAIAWGEAREPGSVAP